MAAPAATTKRSSKDSKRDTRPPARAAAESEQAERTIAPRSAPLAGFTGTRRVPAPVNEPIKSYAPGSAEKKALKDRLKQMAKERVDIPLIIGGREIRTGDTAQSVMPHDHGHVLADWHKASPQARRAGDRGRARSARPSGRTGRGKTAPPCSCKAAELLATTWRATLNAATMLGQSKTAFQAEIDCGLRADRLLAIQPALRAGAVRRAAAVEHRRCGTSSTIGALEGFVYAVTPFNFTSIGGNLADRAGADGQHRDLEAGVDRDAVGVLHHEAARGGGAAAGRDQLRAGRRGRDLGGRASAAAISPACTSPAAPPSSTACGRRSARTCRATRRIRASSARRAARTSSSRTPSADPQALVGGDRARRLRVPGTEVLGREPRVRAAVALARGARPHRGDDRRTCAWATSPTSATSWAR